MLSDLISDTHVAAAFAKFTNVRVMILSMTAKAVISAADSIAPGHYPKINPG